MNRTDVKLPSNRKFGFFFTICFLVGSIYCFYSEIKTGFIVFSSLSLFVLLITIIKADLLFPLNKFWMYLGISIGTIVSPVVLGLVFFGIFSPIGMFMRFLGRDELNLKSTIKSSYWIERKPSTRSDSFEDQF